MGRRLRTRGARARGASSGFTLVELMIAMMLTMILVGVVAFVFTQSSEIVRTTDHRLQAYRTAQFALDRLGRDLQHIYPVADPTIALLMEGTIYAVATNGADLHSDRIRFTTFRDDPAGRRAYLVEWRLDVVPPPAMPTLRRSERLITFTPGAPPALGPEQVDDMAERVLDFQLELAMHQADPTLAGPDRMMPRFRRPDAETAAGDYFYYTGADATLRNANLEARLEVPALMTGTRAPLDFVAPFQSLRISATDLPPGEHTIQSITRGADPVVVQLTELPAVIADVPTVSYTAFALPEMVRTAVRLDLGLGAKREPASLRQTYRLPR